MTIGVGLIGLGEVAQLMHLPLLADDPRWRIASVSDVSAELTEAMGARYNADFHTTDAQRLIEDPSVDAVFILSPDETHAALAHVAMDAGKHVFIEKPAALSVASLRPLIEREDNGKVAFVGYMRRYSRPFLAMKENLPEPDEIRHVRIRDLITESPYFTAQTRAAMRPGDIPAESREKLRAAGEAELRSVLGAGATATEMRAYRALTGLGCHALSAMRDLFGLPTRVLSAAERNGGLALSVLFDYGVFLASYEAVITDIPVFDSGIDVIAQDRRLSLNYDTPYIRHLPTQLTITALGEEGASQQVIGPHYRDPFQAELDAFHAAVTEGTNIRTTLTDAMQDLELIAEISRGFVAMRVDE